ncbi:hypothetical protein EV421DRAFT_1706939, partial [Armillaria borealis]
AYEKCRFLHRDVSGGNILILPNGAEGMLNDWDLAIHIDSPEKDLRQVTRTVKNQYIFTMLLENPLKADVLQDDLESYVHVVMYHGLRYVQHNKVAELLDLLCQIYDLALPLWSGDAQGVMTKDGSWRLQDSPL